MSSLPIPTLSALVLAPALGALVIASLPESRPRLRRGLALAAALSSLGIAGSLALRPGSEGRIPVEIVERLSWIPALGASFELGLDSFSALLAAWVSLLVVAAFLSERSQEIDRSSTVLILFCESALLGLFLARDVYLLFGFLGVWIGCFALLLGRVSPPDMRRFFALHAIGLAMLFALTAVLARFVYVQTGFPSGELARWEGLVLFPDLETRCFLTGALAAAVVTPQLPALLWLGNGLGALPTSERILVTGGYSLVGAYLFYRFVLRLVPRGADGGAFFLLSLVLVGLLFVAIAPRRSGETGLSWGRLLVAYQSLALIGLLTLREGGIASALVLLLHQAAALTAITLCTAETKPVDKVPFIDKVLFVASCVCLLAVPSVAGILSAQWDRSTWIGVIAFVSTAVLAWSIVRWARHWLRGGRLWPSRRRLALIPILAYSLWLATTAGSWELSFGELAEDLLSRLSTVTEHEEADP